MYNIQMGAKCGRLPVVPYRYDTQPQIFRSQVRTPLGTFLRRVQTVTSTQNSFYNLNMEARGGARINLHLLFQYLSWVKT